MVFALILLAILSFSFVFFLKHPLSDIDKAQKKVDKIVLDTVNHDRYLKEHGVVIHKEYTDGTNRFIIDEVHRTAHIASYGAQFVELTFSKVRGCEVS